jgi:cation diffusion facilitator CzcD-associated flavoprotein CzcO
LTQPTDRPGDAPPSPALEALTRQVRDELALLAYPNRPWVVPVSHPSGEPVHDVIVIGGGQAGLGTALALKRDGVTNVRVLDAQPAGREGVWESFARMSNLRTPKGTVGIEGGVPALSAPAFYKAMYGAEAWERIDRIERTRWMDFLRWFRHAAGLDVANDTACRGLGPDGDLIAIAVQSTHAPDAPLRTLRARHVVLATGFDGAGAWHIPAAIASAIAPQRLDHSSGPIDFARLAGRRVGILGHGASAFDNACVALEHGAASVDLCFRRDRIPTVNPHRRLEFAGFLKHFPELDDLTRWRTNRFFEVHDQPPTQNAWDRTHSFAGFRVHAASPWLSIRDDGRCVHVRTPTAHFEFDHVICATGAVVDYDARDELRTLGPCVKRWRHVLVPPAGEGSDTLGEHPYLGPGFEYLPLDPQRDDWVRRVKAFNFSSIVSMGPHTTSASGHKYSIPRLVSGITSRLMADQAGGLLPALQAYDEVELRPVVPAPTPVDAAARR